ncbi:stalk domain-containing protein, partial [Paenibacillus alvei]
KRHGLTLQRVVPHGHWTKKNCPSRILPHWSKFLNMIDREMISQNNPQPAPKPDTQPGNVTIELEGEQVKDGILINGVTYAPVRSIAEACGLHVGWDQVHKIVSLTKGARD